MPLDEKSASPRSRFAADELDPRAFCRQFVRWAWLGLLAVGAVNFTVNPRGQYPPSLFAPLVLPSRQQKVCLFSQMARPPDGLVLGSSRVMKFEPDYLAERLGHSFFNAGVNYAKPEDTVALLRLYLARVGKAPKTVVLGVDVSSFSSDANVDARLIANPTLGPLVPEARDLAGYNRRWKDLLSWSQTTESARSMARTIKQRNGAQPKESYCDDGLLIYLERERQLAEGTYQLGPAIEYNEREYIDLMRAFKQLSRLRCNLFRQFVELCVQNDVELTVFVTPFHPQLRQALLESTEYRDRHADVHQFLASLAAQYSFRLFDFSNIESFNGQATQFVDGIHPLEPNTRAMIDIMFPPRSDVAPREHGEDLHRAVQ